MTDRTQCRSRRDHTVARLLTWYGCRLRPIMFQLRQVLTSGARPHAALSSHKSAAAERRRVPPCAGRSPPQSVYAAAGTRRVHLGSVIVCGLLAMGAITPSDADRLLATPASPGSLGL